MITFLFNRVNYLMKRENPFRNIAFKFCKLTVNLIYPLIHYWDKKTGLDETSDIIISLTSFPDRIKYVWVTIATLLNQTQKPYKVVLWLAEEQFPDKRIPKQLLRMQKRGLEILFCEDLKPHKKYYYSMQKWPDKYVLICDDDMFYPENLVERLWKAHIENEGYIICNSSLEVGYDSDGNIIKRGLWKHESKRKTGMQVCPIGCGGVLYPPNCLDKEVFNKKNIYSIALRQDDIWLKCMAVLHHMPSYDTGQYAHDFFNNIFTQRDGLWCTNLQVLGNSELTPNEVCWNKMVQVYPEIESILKEDYQVYGSSI